MQFGMPTLIENKTLGDNVELCRELGLKFIELNMNFPEYQIDKLEKTDEFIEAAREAGIYYTIHLDEKLNIADFNPLVTEAYLETVHRTIEVARKLLPLRDAYGDKSQSLTLNMHMEHGIFITLPDRKVQMYGRDFDTYMESFKRFRTCVEQWSPCFCMTWDIGHSKAVAEKDVPFIMENVSHLRHFHIHDGCENPPKNHLALGDGEIDLRERLSLAEERNARSVLETKTIEALRKSVAWLKERGRM